MSSNLELKLNRAEDTLLTPALDIRYGQVGLVQVRIRTTDPGAILDELTGRVATAPRFFQRTPVCLDLSALESAPEVSEVRGVIDAVRRAGMLVVGLSNGSLGVEGLSTALELPILVNFRSQSQQLPVAQPVGVAVTTPGASVATLQAIPVAQPVPTEQCTSVMQVIPAAQVAHSAAEAGLPALVHQQPVRSGQRVYGRGRDVVVTASVGAGAEVMADGCVHIYGALRGRAMAGTHGDTGARVFCQEFHAELVSIAGVFRVFETLPADLAGKPVQAWLSGEDMHFARIGA